MREAQSKSKNAGRREVRPCRVLHEAWHGTTDAAALAACACVRLSTNSRTHTIARGYVFKRGMEMLNAIRGPQADAHSIDRVAAHGGQWGLGFQFTGLGVIDYDLMGLGSKVGARFRQGAG